MKENQDLRSALRTGYCNEVCLLDQIIFATVKVLKIRHNFDHEIGCKGLDGFDLAGDSNLSALLYDPTRPTYIKSRSKLFSTLKNATISRRCTISEAMLLPDSRRVFISGSRFYVYECWISREKLRTSSRL
jgi:hypothetical protein